MKGGRDEASKFIGQRFYRTDDRPKGDVFLMDLWKAINPRC